MAVLAIAVAVLAVLLLRRKAPAAVAVEPPRELLKSVYQIQQEAAAAPPPVPNIVREAFEPAPAPRPVAAPPQPVVAAYTPPPPRPSVSLQRDDVKRMFVDWCRDERFPADRAAEPARAHMRLVLADISSPDSEMRGFTDAKQVVEFERIGDAGATDAWLVPNPDARFTPYVTRVFPSLRQGWASDGALYGGVTPRRITLGADGLWALAD
jgi:hypothetical protein